MHLFWITKYRYQVLEGDLKLTCRDILHQLCNSLDIQIIKGVVSKDHIHLHLSYLPQLSISDIVRRLKGRSSRLLLQEFPELRRDVTGVIIFLVLAMVFGLPACYRRYVGSLPKPSQI